MKKVRLLKVVVQPVFIIEDEDGDLEEFVNAPVPVTAKDWPTYSSVLFKSQLKAYEAELNKPQNRKDRRKKPVKKKAKKK